MATGTVKWFNDAKGYGFITPDDGSEDLRHLPQMGGFKTLRRPESVVRVTRDRNEASLHIQPQRRDSGSQARTE